MASSLPGLQQQLEVGATVSRPLGQMPLAPSTNTQLAHLVDRAQWSNIELRILPFDVGLHVGAASPFNILSFPDRLLADAAYQEYAVGGDVIDDQSVVSQLDTLFGKLRSQSLGANESLALIAELAEDTRLI